MEHRKINFPLFVWKGIFPLLSGKNKLNLINKMPFMKMSNTQTIAGTYSYISLVSINYDGMCLMSHRFSVAYS